MFPVRVSEPCSDKQLKTYAFLDSGSDTTLCFESLVEELSLESEPAEFTLLLEEHRVFILIGSDRPDIINDSSGMRRGGRGQLHPVNTSLGWTVYGPMGEPNSDGVHVNFAKSDHEEMLSMQLERLYNVEFKDALVDVEESLPFEDQRAKQIMDESAVLVNGYYKLKLPFRHSPPYLPDSLPAAKKRLYWLKTRMEKDPEFHKQYASFIQKYQEEGSSRQAPDEKVSTLEPIWYVPHHAVWHARNPDEPRSVFHCACKPEVSH